ncbi:hypothetical protein O3P69_002472 [Scylla paramamosain]|uniref:Uncharacterized protein n=1 Tax=Scylla paramamosain TaxID=85552 RepID=A0AAW0UPB8_SCYPA
MLGMWLVLSLIISTVYRSNLKAMLIKPRLVLPFTNLMELTKSGIPCFVVRGTVLHSNIQGAEVGSAVWQLNNRLILHSDVALAVKDMSAGKHAIFTTHLGLLSVIHTSFVQTKTCSIYMTSDSYFGPKCLSIVFRKGSPLRQHVNPIIVKLRESGILEHLLMKYVVYASTCLHSDPASVEDILRPLEIGDMYGVCFVYVGGRLSDGLAEARREWLFMTLQSGRQERKARLTVLLNIVEYPRFVTGGVKCLQVMYEGSVAAAPRVPVYLPPYM